MRKEPYYSFWQRIHKNAGEKNFPLRVMFELTYGCNFRCAHCYVPLSYRARYKTKELRTKEVFSILGQLKEAGCFYLGFTGGEPFLRKDIIQILLFAKRKGFQIIIYTNGSLINKKIASELKKINPNKVDITIPAISEEAFRHITGIAGAKDRVFKAIELLHEKGINLGFKTCILKENESEIGKIGKFTRSFGGTHRWDDMLTLCLDGSKEPYRHRSSAITALENRARSDKENFFDKCDFKKRKELFQCGAGSMQAAITPAGELKMCLAIDYPKHRILESSFKKAWQGLVELRESIESDNNTKCNNCKLSAYCDWCPAKAWLKNRTFTACSPESRHWAEIRRLDYASGKS